MQGKFNWGRVLLSGASLAALGAGASYAQDAEVSDEIIVTATGRAAAIQDVPIAVTAVSGEAVQDAGIHDIRDLAQLAPSYFFYTGQSNTASTNAQIRGLGTGSDNPGFEAAVGVFIDGVYRSRAGTALADLPEIERIELLRGPQGTLFGRNTSAGALNIVTAGPEFETHAWMEGTAGDLDLMEAKVGFTAPVIADTLAVRLDASGRTRDGYIEDLRSGEGINTRERWSARAQALWDISPDASLRLIVDGGNSNEICCYGVTRQRNLSGLAINGFLAATQPGVAVGVLPGNVSTGNPISFVNPGLADFKARQVSVTPGRMPTEDIQEWGASGQLDWDLGEVEFTSISSFRDWDSQRSQDIDFSDFDRAYRDGLGIRFETITQEFRLHGEFGRLDWLVGAFIGNEKLTQTDRIRFGTQAANYLDILASGQNLTPLGLPDANGASPGSGYEIYRSLNPAAPLFLQAAYGTLAATQDTSTPAGAAIAAALGGAAAPGGLATDLSTADPVDGEGQQKDNWVQQTDSYAVFSHNEVSITDDLIWTLGVRFNHEEKDYKADLNSISPACNAVQGNAASAAAVLAYTPNPLLPAATQAGLRTLAGGVPTFLALACNPVVNPQANGLHADERTEDEWTGTTSLAYHATPDLMFYGGYSRGYKSGGYNLDRSGFGSLLPFSVTPPADTEPNFDPEFVDSYELGMKSTLFGGGTNLNLTVFYERIEDFQLNAFSGFNFITFNAPELISKGVELEASTRITDNLTVSGGVTYDDAYYNKAVPDPNSATPLVPEGATLANAAEWVGTLAVTYRQPIGDTLEALAYIDGRYSSENPTSTLARNPLKDNLEGYGLVNGRLGIGTQSGSWGLELWGRNLTDETYFVGSFTVPEQDTINIYPNEPRTWGVTLRARY
jgi:iron complex outermembrane recepter protein